MQKTDKLLFDKQDYINLLRSKGFTPVDMKSPIDFINGRELIARPRRCTSLKGVLHELSWLWDNGVRYIGVHTVEPLINVWKPMSKSDADYFKRTMYIRSAHYADYGKPGDGHSRYCDKRGKCDCEDIKYHRNKLFGSLKIPAGYLEWLTA